MVLLDEKSEEVQYILAVTKGKIIPKYYGHAFSSWPYMYSVSSKFHAFKIYYTQCNQLSVGVHINTTFTKAVNLIGNVSLCTYSYLLAQCMAGRWCTRITAAELLVYHDGYTTRFPPFGLHWHSYVCQTSEKKYAHLSQSQDSVTPSPRVTSAFCSPTSLL